MANTIKYVPAWHITFNGVTYSPSAPGEPQKTIEGLPENEITRLLAMGAIKKLAFEESEPEKKAPPAVKSLEQMNFNELKAEAKKRGVPVPVGTNTETLRVLLTKPSGEGGDDDNDDDLFEDEE